MKKACISSIALLLFTVARLQAQSKSTNSIVLHNSIGCKSLGWWRYFLNIFSMKKCRGIDWLFLESWRTFYRFYEIHGSIFRMQRDLNGILAPASYWFL